MISPDYRIPDVPTIVNCGNTFPIKITSIIHDDSLQGIKILMSGEGKVKTPMTLNKLLCF